MSAPDVPAYRTGYPGISAATSPIVGSPVKGPDVPPHDAGSFGYKLADGKAWHRVSCLCGWRGCWWATQEQAEESFNRHQRGIVVTFQEGR